MGVIATLIDFLLLYIFVTILKFNLYFSVVLAFCLSLTANYILSMLFVFKPKEGLTKRRQFIIFIATSLAGLLINQGVIFLGEELFHIYYMVSKLAAALIVVFFSFFSRQFLLEGVMKLKK